MLTDWLAILRTATDLRLALRGARVLEVGIDPAGRLVIALRTPGGTRHLVIALFASPPLLWLRDADAQPLRLEPGFVRTADRTMRRMVVAGVRARRGDRLLRFDLTSRSSFGVSDDLAFVLELVPRFGNAILLKGETIVTAAKTFSLSENPVRVVQIGGAYTPPPRHEDPDGLPRLLHESLALHPAARDASLAMALAAANDPTQPVLVYERDARIVAAYPTPLAQFGESAPRSMPSMPAAFAAYSEQAQALDASRTHERVRTTLLRRMREKRRALRTEHLSLEQRRSQALERDTLRAQGQALLHHLYELEPSEQQDAKERAARLFARYRKAGSSLAHIERRLAQLDAQLEALDALSWELERADAHTLGDVEEALDALLGRPGNAQGRPRCRKHRARLPWVFELEPGVRVYVGRSPTENAEITFRIAKAHDWWFHARGAPGAHVILQRDDRQAPSQAQLEAAAAVAALHSRATKSQWVAVDYTQRRYVRKAPASPPGLVFYTQAQTLTVAPAPPPVPSEDAPRTRPN